MKYPKEIGPQSQTEFAAWLFSMLGNAYNIIAQYEAEDERREYERRMEALRPVCIDCGAKVDEEHKPTCHIWAHRGGE